MYVRSLLAATLLLPMMTVASRGADDPGFALRPGEKARTILAPGDSWTLGVAGVTGGRCTMSVRAVGKSRAVPRLGLIPPDGSPLGERGEIVNSSRSSSVRKVRFDASGQWRATVSLASTHGGEVELSLSAKVPASQRFEGATAGDPGEASVPFGAVPGSTASVEVRFEGKPRPPIEVAVLGPDGAEIASSAADSGRVVLRGLAIASTELHTIRVRGGPAEFRAVVRTKLPRPRRGLGFDDVETYPVVTDVTPTTAPDDGVRDFLVRGYGFSSRHRLALTLAGTTAASSAFKSFGDDAAVADIDLEGEALGTYGLAILVPPGRRLVLPGTIEVTNLPAGVLLQTPAEIPHDAEFTLRLDGVGFDEGSTVEVRRSADGLEIPVLSVTRESHRLLEARLKPPQYAVGRCDVTITDGDDGWQTLRQASLDLLGSKGPSASVRTVTAPSPTSNSLNARFRTAALDDATGRLLLSVRNGARIAFVLVDTATWGVLDVLEPALSNPANVQARPRVAFHPLDGTWALAWSEEGGGGPNQATSSRLLITEGGDLRSARFYGIVASAWYVDFVTPAPDVNNGGWHVYWSDLSDDDETGSLKLLRFSADGVQVPGNPLVLEAWVNGIVGGVDAEQLPDGRFVVVYASHPQAGDASFAVVRLVVRSDGLLSVPRRVCADPPAADGVWVPFVAAHPTDGSACIGVSWYDSQTVHPAAVRLAPETFEPGPLLPLVPQTDPVGGFVNGLVWNAERGEYAASIERLDDFTEVRRISAQGVVRPEASRLTFEGVDGLVWAGRTAGTLGLLRLFDGSADGYHIRSTPEFQTVCTPLR